MSESTVLETPLGPITLMSKDDAIISLRFGDYGENGENTVLKKAKKELEEYFGGERKAFKVRINPEGTEYQKRVWVSALRIPYGETRSYGWVSEIAGGSPRSAGNALGANPIPIIIPCHRVIRKDGSLGGYTSGIGMKMFLIEHEKEFW